MREKAVCRDVTAEITSSGAGGKREGSPRGLYARAEGAMGSDGLGHAERVRGRRRQEKGGRRCEAQALPGIRSGASFVLGRPQEALFLLVKG